MADKQAKATGGTRGQQVVMKAPLPDILDEIYRAIDEAREAEKEARQAAEAAHLAAVEAETKGREAAAAAKEEAAAVADSKIYDLKLYMERQFQDVWDSIGKLNGKIAKLAGKVTRINDAVIAGVDAFNAVIMEK